jgi:PAS domain S-box-containing protein
MKKFNPIILIKANDKIGTLVKSILSENFPASVRCINCGKDTRSLVKKKKPDLVIYELVTRGNTGIELLTIHKRITDQNNPAVIYLVNDKLLQRLSFKGMETCTFDILTIPPDQHLFLNKANSMLQIKRYLDLSASSNSNNRKTTKKDSDTFQVLEVLTSQLSSEISNHLRTMLELKDKNLNFIANEVFLKKLLDAIPNPILIKNAKEEFVHCNTPFLDLFKIKIFELRDTAAFNRNHPQLFNMLYESDNKSIQKNRISVIETYFQKADGSTLELMVYKKPLKYGKEGSMGMIISIIDITEIKRAQILLNIQNTIEYLSSLNKGLKNALENIIDKFLMLYWVDYAGIYLYDEDNRKINLVCHRGLSEKFVSEVESYTENSLQMNLLSKRANVYFDPTNLSPRTAKLAREESILSIAILPLFDNETNKLVGSLNLASKKFQVISEQDKQGIELIALRIVNLIIFAQTQDEIKKAHKLLSRRVEEKSNDLQIKIAELIKKENQVRVSEDRYRRLQDNIPIGIYSTDHHGNLLHLNVAAVKMFGYKSISEMSTVPVKDLYLNPGERDGIIQNLVKKGFVNNLEVQLVRKDKTIFWGLLSVNSRFDSGKNQYQFDGIIEDISEIKKAKTALEEANKKIISINKNLEKRIHEALKKQESQSTLLIQKSKLESLGELSAGIAHEINQPLGIISLAFENLKVKITSGKLTPDYLNSKFESIYKNISRIREIIDHIRTFSREQDSFILDKVDVNKIVRRTLNLIGAQYRNHNIKIRLEVKEDLGFTVGSNFKLEQVILNLLSNAKYALEEKAIYMDETEYVKEILISTESTKKKIILKIEDNGEGIKSQYLARLFDPFFTTKPEGFGTGLGLSIVYGIVKDMRGDIIVNSKEKKFTKFTISFPRFPENN